MVAVNLFKQKTIKMKINHLISRLPVLLAFGALVSFAIAFFGTGALSLLSLYSGGPNIISLAEYHAFEYITILFLSVVLGSFVGYHYGKLNNFQQPKWAKWLEDHYGII